MSLSSLHLDAFMMVAKSKSFSEAAQRLHITQSALSQRVLNLEGELQVSLFVREPSGVRMTERGEQLLKYCQAKESLEEEFLSGIKLKNKKELSGLARIAAFSTQTRSVLLPKLGAFARSNPHVQIELLTREIRDLPRILRSGEVDFIFCDHLVEKQGWVNRLLGYEEYILIESRQKTVRENTYLDHDEFDSVTSDFWKIQKAAPKNYQRAYFDEIYTIIEAVEEGFGRAVVPLHLIRDNHRVAVVKGLKSLKSPIYLIYFKQAFYTQLQLKLITYLA